jgi:hypothetical protein
MVMKVKKELFALQKKKDKLQAFFRHPEVKYYN